MCDTCLCWYLLHTRKPSIARLDRTDKVFDLSVNKNPQKNKVSRSARQDCFPHREALLERGRSLMQARDSLIKSGDSLEAMFMACIDAGFNSRDDIIRAVPKHVGHSYAHVAALLDSVTGPDRHRHLCYRDECKKYHLHPAPRLKARRTSRQLATTLASWPTYPM